MCCCTLQGLANADDENFVVEGVQLANVSEILGIFCGSVT
jgi:hypothetical protein